MDLWERASSHFRRPRTNRNVAGKAGGRFARFGDKVINTVGNLTRWVIIGVMFVFLLTMAIVLTEVMSFQDRVVRLVGDSDRARATVLMLHEIQNHPDAYSEDPSLPYAALAVFLDRVRSAQEQLGRFRGIQGVVPAPDQKQAKDVEDPVTVRFAKERTRLTDSLNELNRALFQEDPQFKVAQSLAGIGRSVNQLDRFVAHTTSPDAATILAQVKGARSDLATIRERGDLADQNTDQLEQVEQLDASAAGLENLLAAGDQSDRSALSAQIEQVRADLAPLDHGGAVPALAPILAGLDDATTRLQQALADDQGSAVGAAAAAQMVAGVDGLRAKLTDLRAAAELDARVTGLSDEIDRFEETVEGLYALRLEAPSGLQAPGPGAPSISELAREAQRQAAFGAALAKIDGAQSDLDRALTARFGTQYTVAKALANNINTMRDQSEAFVQLRATTHTSPTGDVSDAKAAADAYQETLAELNQGFADLERALSNRTRVVAVGNVIRGNTAESEEQANHKARAILQDFDALSRFDAIMLPLSLVAPKGSTLAQIGIHPQKLATLSTVSITTIYIFMIGAIGSLLYIAKYFIGQALRGRAITDPPNRPLSWLIFRPFFGVVVAFALYLVVQAGQLAFGTDGGDGFGTDLNIPIISVVALFAGLLSWHALAAIESRGEAWFGAQRREPLWATGLNNALRNENKTVGTCAAQVGRSPEQIERWLLYVDQVTVEMQDRLITWLKRDIDELFSGQKPNAHLGGEALWATGLREALASGERRLDAKGLAELLDEEDERRVRKWLDLKLQVSPAMQWKLVDALKVPHYRLFDRHINNQPAWAVGLRRAMEHKGLTARLLDERIELDDIGAIRAWRELDRAVPVDLQDDLVEALEVSHDKLFHRGELDDQTLLWAHDLDAILAKEGRNEVDLATEVDVELQWVTDWIRRTRPVAPATRKRIAAFLNRKEEDIFKSHRGHLPRGTPPAP